MTEVNALVAFYSRYGATEELALAGGVGAVQAHANIRLRRVKDLADAETMACDARWSENLERMNRDYIVPREIDVDWADVILVASCADSLRETELFVEGVLATQGRNERLLMVPLVDTTADASADRLALARAQGREAVENARKLKT